MQFLPYNKLCSQPAVWEADVVDTVADIEMAVVV